MFIIAEYKLEERTWALGSDGELYIDLDVDKPLFVGLSIKTNIVYWAKINWNKLTDKDAINYLSSFKKFLVIA